MIERLAVRTFFALLLAFAFRMTWQAAYLQGRESIFNAAEQAAIQAESCYSYDGDCSDHKTTKPKGEHHAISSVSKSKGHTEPKKP